MGRQYSYYLCIEMGISCIQNTTVRGMSKESNRKLDGAPCCFSDSSQQPPAAAIQGRVFLWSKLCKFCKGVLKNDVNTVKILEKKRKLKASENTADSYHHCNVPFPWKWFGHKYTHLQWDTCIYTLLGKSGTSGDIIFILRYKTRSTPCRMERQMAKGRHDKEI